MRALPNIGAHRRYFKPPPGLLLAAWLMDSKDYTGGRLNAARNYIMHPESNQRFLTDEAAAIIRAILQEFPGISQTILPTLFCYFSVLFTRRVPGHASLDPKGIDAHPPLTLLVPIRSKNCPRRVPQANQSEAAI